MWCALKGWLDFWQKQTNLFSNQLYLLCLFCPMYFRCICSFAFALLLAFSDSIELAERNWQNWPISRFNRFVLSPIVSADPQERLNSSPTIMHLDKIDENSYRHVLKRLFSLAIGLPDLLCDILQEATLCYKRHCYICFVI